MRHDSPIYPIASLPEPSTRHTLTLAQKADAARYFLSGATVPQVTRQFKCCVRTAKYITSKAQEIIKITEESPFAIQHKCIRFVRYSDIEARLFDFVQVARSARLPITRKTLEARALSIRDNLLGASTEDYTTTRVLAFGASSSWLTCFVSRYALRKLHGEAGGVNVSEVAEDIEKLRLRLQDFRAEFMNSFLTRMKQVSFLRFFQGELTYFLEKTVGPSEERRQ